jgi:hypothetical protein
LGSIALVYWQSQISDGAAKLEAFQKAAEVVDLF